jgi:O-antigen/teichoic acid export membrane protein
MAGTIQKQTIQGTISSYAGVLIGTATQAFLIPNFLSTEENGLMALLLSWMYIFCQVASLGFNSAGTKFFPFFRNPEENHRGFLFHGLVIQGIGFLLTAGLYALAKPWLLATKAGENPLYETYFWYLLPMAAATLVFNLFDNYARGLYDSVFGTFYSQVFQRFLVLLAVLTVVFGWLSFSEFMPLWSLAIMAPALFMIFRAYRLGNFSLKPSNTFFQSPQAKGFVQFAGFSILTGLSSMIILHLDKIMISKYLGLGDTGIYNTIFLFSSVMGMSYMTVIKASSAIVIDGIQENRMKDVETIYQKSSINLLIFGCLLLATVWVSIDELFSFIKPEYAKAKYALLWIGLGKLVDLAHGINGLILSNSKYYKLDSFLVISFVGLLYFLNDWLIPAYGIEGATYAAFGAVLYYNSLRTGLIWYFFRIQPFRFTHLVILAIFGGCMGLGYLLPTVSGWAFVQLVFQSSLIGVVFGVLIWMTNVSPELTRLFQTVFRAIGGSRNQ